MLEKTFVELFSKGTLCTLCQLSVSIFHTNKISFRLFSNYWNMINNLKMILRPIFGYLFCQIDQNETMMTTWQSLYHIKKFWPWISYKLRTKPITNLNVYKLQIFVFYPAEHRKKIVEKIAMGIRKVSENDLQRYFDLCNEEKWGIGFARIRKMVAGSDF